MEHKRDLTISEIDRQNILNNKYAIQEIKEAIGITGILFENQYIVLKEQIASFFDVTTRTIENCIEKNSQELKTNGYEIIKGNRLKELINIVKNTVAPEINFASKTTQLSIFPFRAFLNIGMLLQESDQAAMLRQLILDIVIDCINQRSGNSTKYINQRDEDFICSWYSEENYRKQLTDALKDCVTTGQWKYPLFTNKIYKSIFLEKAAEYREILKLEQREKTRDTFYSEILDLVASFECGFADMLQRKSKELGRAITIPEAIRYYSEFEEQPLYKPLIEKARNKMASRDLAFRDVIHQRLEGYITPIPPEDFERFIGEKSEQLEKRLQEAKDVMERLKNK